MRTSPRHHGRVPLTALILTLAACSPRPGEVHAADDLHPFEFVNVARDSGIDVRMVSGDPRRWYIFESNGSGAAWLDYDVDGDIDLFVGNGSEVRYVDDGRRLEVVRGENSRLYRNDGELRFRDVSRDAGCDRWEWVNAVAVGDVDNDGDPDMYLGCFGRDVFLRNEGMRYIDATRDAGLENLAWAAGATFGDPDADGDLDLYVANYVRFDLKNPPAEGRRNEINGVEVAWGPIGENKRGLNAGAPNVYFENDGRGHFQDATLRAGLAQVEALCSYAAVFTDVTGDGAVDLLVANDLQRANLYINDGLGVFTEGGGLRGFSGDGEGRATSAMGLAVADIDRDGDLDVLRTNFDLEPNNLHLNDGHGNFTERARPRGLAHPSEDRLGWAAAFFDADLDGDLDLLVANGHVYPQAERIGMHSWLQTSQLFAAEPDPEVGLRWRDVTADVRGDGSLQLPRSARGLALGDPDDDGDLDVLITDMDERPRLLENRSLRRGHWLKIKTIGTRSNRDGYGARITVRAGGVDRVAEVRPIDGLYCSHDPRVHFGLGPVAAVDWIEVRWPSGIVHRVEAPALDTLHPLIEPGE